MTEKTNEEDLDGFVHTSDRSKAIRGIVDELGGVTKTARAMKQKSQNVNNWINRGVIPATSLPRLLKVYAKHWMKEQRAAVSE